MPPLLDLVKRHAAKHDPKVAQELEKAIILEREERLERAAIQEYDGGLTREEANLWNNLRD